MGRWSDGGSLAIGAGEGLELFTWLGDDWDTQNVWTDCLDAVWGDSHGKVWVVGRKGGILRREFQ